MDTAQPLVAGLYIVSTPIGHLRDITLRALDTLAAVDEILAEDTRIARKLLDAYGIGTRVTSYHDHNGAQRRPGILAALEDGRRIAIISDAGTPLVSDPGFKLVRDVAAEGHAVIPIPGPSALLAGLVTAGLPTDRFTFVGFLPQKSAARRSALASLSTAPGSLVIYESGPRLAAMLKDASDVLGGERQSAVARELTKRFEETRRDTLGALSDWYAEHGPPKGEIVVLIGPEGASNSGEQDLDRLLGEAMQDLSLKAASEAVSKALGLPRRTVYQRALTLKKDQRDE